MSVLRSTSAVALTTAALALTGCGSTPTKAADEPTGTAPTTAVAPTAGVTPSETPTRSTATTTSSPTVSTSAATADCAADAVPDGTWTGPVTMDVDGNAKDTGFGSSKGSGTMTMVVKKGHVTGGHWNVSWKSQGSADTGQAAATIKLDGTISGGMKGPATKPVLLGSWAIHGTAKITKPITSSAPVDETGKDTETLSIDSATCDEVEGSFLPSFNSKDTAATFSGTARWTGKPQG
jgi:hypothetical protein